LSGWIPCLWVPHSNRALFLGGILFLITLLVLALVIEFFRYLRERRRLQALEWTRVEDAVTERGLTPEEWQLLKTIITNHRPGNPMTAVSEFRVFDACVEAELAAIEARGDMEQYEAIGGLLRGIRSRLGLDFVPYGHPIRSTRELPTNHTLWIATVSTTPPDWYRTRIIGVDEAHFVITAWPGAETSPPNLKPNDEARCHMWRDDDARYGFRAVVSRYDHDPPTWVLHHTSELNRIQSREYYRARIDQPTTVRLLKTPLNGATDHTDALTVLHQLEGRITSLSGGGLALLLNRDPGGDRLLRVAIKIPGEAPFDVEVRVVDVEPLGTGRFRIRGAFIGVSEDRRDQIVHYVSHRQQMLLAAEDRTEETLG